MLRIVQSIIVVSVAYSVLIAVYFLGYFRLESPARFKENDDAEGNPSAAAAKKATTCSKSSSLQLFTCRHNQEDYLCFPPYCAPGGLRSRLFPAAADISSVAETSRVISIKHEEHIDDNNSRTRTYYTTSNSTTTPIDILLKNPHIVYFLPTFVKRIVQDCQDDWVTLGGSRCCFVLNTLSANRKQCRNRHHYHYQQQQKRLHSDNCTSSKSDPNVSPEEEVEERQQPEILQQTEKENQQKKYCIMTATEQTAVAATTVQEASPISSDKVLPQAILVYHESAHSIVFRDHLRRQQGAIRHTSTIMEHQNNVRRNASPSPSRTYRKDYPQSVTSASGDVNSTVDEVYETDGYESSGSTKSNRSQSSIAPAYKSGDDANSSITSGGSSRSNSRSKYVQKDKNDLPNMRKINTPSPTPSSSPSISSVVVANFQPVIEPLEALDLNAKHVFEPLFDADPYSIGEDRLELTEAESEVVKMLKEEKAVVKTVRNQDWTSFLNKFKPEGGEGAGKYLPAPWEQYKMKEDLNKGINVRQPFNSFVTSTSLLPSCGKKMRCFGSTNEYAIGVVFALPTCFPKDESEDAAAKRTRTWSW